MWTAVAVDGIEEQTAYTYDFDNSSCCPFTFMQVLTCTDLLASMLLHLFVFRHKSTYTRLQELACQHAAVRFCMQR